MIAGILIGVLAAVAVVAAKRWWGRRPDRSDTIEFCGWVDGPNWCDRRLNNRHVHWVVSQPADEIEGEFAGWGGTFISQAFCREHCPGGCANRRCRARIGA